MYRVGRRLAVITAVVPAAVAVDTVAVMACHQFINAIPHHLAYHIRTSKDLTSTTLAPAQSIRPDRATTVAVPAVRLAMAEHTNLRINRAIHSTPVRRLPENSISDAPVCRWFIDLSRFSFRLRTMEL